jgi:hypothetical protein
VVDRPLERLAAGTATVVATTVGLFLAAQFLPSLRRTLLSVGTVPAGMLFGYLWLLTLVAGGALIVPLADRGPVDAGWSALVGAAVALVVLTTLFVIGFVAPSGPVDPAGVDLLPALAASVAVGLAAGTLAWGVVSAALRMSRRLVSPDG